MRWSSSLLTPPLPEEEKRRPLPGLLSPALRLGSSQAEPLPQGVLGDALGVTALLDVKQGEDRGSVPHHALEIRQGRTLLGVEGREGATERVGGDATEVTPENVRSDGALAVHV